MTIPASDIVVVNPGVITAGGNPLALNGVILSKDTVIPTNSVLSFASAAAVSSYFGPASPEYAMALTYFAGFDGSTIKPGALIFGPYVDVDRAAYLRSGSLASLSLTQLQAITAGTLTVTVDGVAKTSASINLAGASSFSNAATLIAAGFTGGGAPTCTWNPINSSFSLNSPTTGLTSTVTFATTNALATALKLTSATGAILSQGDTADTPATAMDCVASCTQNWAGFTTVWEPDLTNKQLFAAWVQTKNQKYLYAAWDSDAQAIVNGSTTCFGAVAKALAYDGVVALYNTAALAALWLGSMASIDFSSRNGRITFAFKSQAGFTATVTSQQVAANLTANGYSFYGSYAQASQQFNFLYNGQMAGKWNWADSYVNQIQLNSQFQLALMTLLTNVKSIPYNENGYSLIRASMAAPITDAINFGSIRQGIALSAAQSAQVNQAAGLDVTKILQQSGYYLQVIDPGTTVRGQRGSPVINFWYTDGQAIQKITIASTDIL